MAALVWLIYNIAVLAVSVFLTIHFNSGWWMLFALIAATSLKTTKGEKHDK